MRWRDGIEEMKPLRLQQQGNVTRLLEMMVGGQCLAQRTETLLLILHARGGTAMRVGQKTRPELQSVLSADPIRVRDDGRGRRLIAVRAGRHGRQLR